MNKGKLFLICSQIITGTYNMISYKKPNNPKFRDLAGTVAGKLTVIRFHHTINHQSYWLCLCECGNEIVVLGINLRRYTNSCGCKRVAMCKTGKNQSTHGLKKHPLYAVWDSMRARCNNQNNKGYANYGGRGISVCAEWNNDFKTFYDWAITGYKPGLELDRYPNNDGNYEPSNCRWATNEEQGQNTRNTILNPFKVRIAKRLLTDFNCSQSETGEMLGGIKRATIRVLAEGKTWKNINLSINEMVA